MNFMKLNTSLFILRYDSLQILDHALHITHGVVGSDNAFFVNHNYVWNMNHADNVKCLLRIS